MTIKIPTTIRVERNLVKHNSFIFPHPRTKGLDKQRIESWVADGVDCSIIITPMLHSTTPTSRSHKILLAIFIHAQLEKIDTTKPIPISLRRIADILGKKWNGRVAEEICKELKILRSANFEWKESFEEKGKTNGYMSLFSILNDVQFKAKDIKKDEYFKGVKSIVVEFNRKIAQNLQDNYCIPINLKVYELLNDKPYIQIIYLKIGLWLASNKYKPQQLSAFKIINILNIESQRYLGDAGKKNRKAFLEEIRLRLDRQPLATSYMLNVSISETVNQDDYKLIISTKKIETTPRHQLEVRNKDENLVQWLCHEVIKAIGISYKLLADDDKASIKHYCEVYPQNLIELAMTTYKERTAFKEQQGQIIKSKFAFFAACLHHQAHDSSMLWIKDCGADCKYKSDEYKANENNEK